MFLCRLATGGVECSDRLQASDHERGADHLPADPPHPDHCVRHQLLQGLLLRGPGHRQPHRPPSAHHPLHQCSRSSLSLSI